MLKWLKQIRIKKLIKLVVLNDSVLQIIIDMQRVGDENNLKPVLNNDFLKWVQQQFVINHAILLRFKRDGYMQQSSVDFILNLDKELRKWYRKSPMGQSGFQTYDEAYNKPLRGWENICADFFDDTQR